MEFFMVHRLKDKPLIWNKTDSEASEFHFLVLYNDEIHTFNYVIESLVEVCSHSYVQAEQCAMITHFNGKCEVKKGIRKDLELMQTDLSKRGLITTID
jgi:ATP-dependent Clp protease adaptor protein ClpS